MYICVCIYVCVCAYTHRRYFGCGALPREQADHVVRSRSFPFRATGCSVVAS